MLSKPVLLHFKFDSFAALPSAVNTCVKSEAQTDRNGNSWKLMLCPGGRNIALKGWITLIVISDSRNEDLVAAHFNIAVKNASGTIACDICGSSSYDAGHVNWGRDCMKRDMIFDPNNDILKDGALCFDVTIQVKDRRDKHYDPKSNLSKRMMKLLESGDGADASFKVGDQMFPVHSNILRTNAPTLAIANLLDQEERSSVTIEGISAPVFKLVLEFIYAEHRPTDKEIICHAKELIYAVNRYELVDLKMIVEHTLVRECIFRKYNVCDWIIFADAQSCPLLKEYATSFLLLNVREVLKSEHSKRLRESSKLLAEILMLVSDNNEGRETLAVNELRKELHKRKLNVDGSKEMLVRRLDEAKRQRIDG
eukprot:scaffold92217_cov68-Cyclotella_meneghiniana.AAC.1